MKKIDLDEIQKKKIDTAKAIGVSSDDMIVSLSKKVIVDIKDGKIKAFIKSFPIDNTFHIVESMKSTKKEYIKNVNADISNIIITRNSIFIDDVELDSKQKEELIKELGFTKESDIYKAYKNILDTKTKYKAYVIKIKSFLSETL